MAVLRTSVLACGLLAAATASGNAQLPARVEFATGSTQVGAGQWAAADLGGGTSVGIGPLRLDADARLGTLGGELRRLRGSSVMAGPRMAGILQPRASLRVADDRIGSDPGRSRVDGGLAVDLGDESLGLSVGYDLAGAWHSGVASRVQTRSGSAWWQRGPALLRLSYAGVRVEQQLQDRSAPAAAMAQPLAYADVSGEVRLRTRVVEVEGALARRLGGHAMERGFYGGASAALRLGAGTHLVLRHDRVAPDPALHLPAQRSTSVGIRLSGAQVGVRDREAVADEARLRVEVLDARAGWRTVRIVTRARDVVELAGSFTQWEPVPLVHVGGDVWEVTLRIPDGVHHYNVRRDGRAWTVPEGARTAADEFQGVVAVLVAD